ncbi:MAG: transglutaminase family protein [Stagnimonas sp.]|nr:transglutaminase family protein [Stagnimonas sp.]
MLIRAGYEIIFDLPNPTVVTTLLNVVPERREALLRPDLLRAYANGKRVFDVGYFRDHMDNVRARISAPAGELRLYNDFVIADSGEHLTEPFDAYQHALDELPGECLEFLLPSRYCEVDSLSQTAWQMFGQTPLGWSRVRSVCNWVKSNITFGYAYARNTRTALETFNERVGVCRDLNHLAITFLRALNIPTRYATGYLGDIGIPINPAPMDFSACFEVYLGGRWHLWDARHNEPRIGWILLGRGRDAADCAITTSYGVANLKKFQVWTDEVNSAAIPSLDGMSWETLHLPGGQTNGADFSGVTRDNQAFR